VNTDTDSPMKTARIAKGWSQRQLANVVTASGQPVSHPNLSRIERGEVKPSPKLRKAIAEALGIAGTDLP